MNIWGAFKLIVDFGGELRGHCSEHSNEEELMDYWEDMKSSLPKDVPHTASFVTPQGYTYATEEWSVADGYTFAY